MDYLYFQAPIDGIYHNQTVTGVPVDLIAIGSDGKVIDIGTVTTNGYYGTFSKAWTPPNSDTYTIVATFAGDDSYGSSSSATAVAVTATSATPTPQPTTTTTTTTINASDVVGPLTTYLVVGIIAIIIAIAIVGMLLLRKRA